MDTYRSEYVKKLESDGALYARDVLNILLSNAFGGSDMSDIADRLLARFPSVKAVIHAEPDEITAVEGVSERVAMYLKTLSLIEKYEPDNGFSEIKDVGDFLSKLAVRFTCRDSEYAEFYLVNARGAIVGSKRFTSDSVEFVQLPTEEFIGFLIKNKAHGLYCAHNHVGESCAPSMADDAITRKIEIICSTCDVRFFDHAIIDSQGGIFSYAQSGRFDAIKKNNL